jgi:hypothetical protein
MQILNTGETKKKKRMRIDSNYEWTFLDKEEAIQCNSHPRPISNAKTSFNNESHFLVNLNRR